MVIGVFFGLEFGEAMLLGDVNERQVGKPPVHHHLEPVLVGDLLLEDSGQCGVYVLLVLIGFEDQGCADWHMI